MRSVRPSYAHGDRAGLDSVRARQKEREFFPIPFFLDFVRGGGGFREMHFSKLRLRVRASVRPSRSLTESVVRPEALESVDFASPKLSNIEVSRSQSTTYVNFGSIESEELI